MAKINLRGKMNLYIMLIYVFLTKRVYFKIATKPHPVKLQCF